MGKLEGIEIVFIEHLPDNLQTQIRKFAPKGFTGFIEVRFEKDAIKLIPMTELPSDKLHRLLEKEGYLK